MAAILHWAHGVAVLCMMDVNPSIHIAELYLRSPMAQLSSQIVAHETVVIDMQPEIILNTA